MDVNPSVLADAFAFARLTRCLAAHERRFELLPHYDVTRYAAALPDPRLPLRAVPTRGPVVTHGARRGAGPDVTDVERFVRAA